MQTTLRVPWKKLDAMSLIYLMNGESVLLDTNIIIEHFRPSSKHGAAIEKHVLYVPEIVVAELYAGALRSQRPAHHRKVADEFLESVILLRCDLETAQHYAELWSRLADKGKLIPHNDIWIASLAIQHGLKLITNDKHFVHVAGLEHESWYNW